MTVKRPVSGSLARAFFSMIVLSVLISAIALVTLASSQRDAEAINIAGVDPVSITRTVRLLTTHCLKAEKEADFRFHLDTRWTTLETGGANRFRAKVLTVSSSVENRPKSEQ